jgi:hypothetical protein
MSYGRDLRIEPTPAVTSPAPVQPVQHEAHVASPAEHKPARDPHPAAVVTTGGTLRAAYAQYDVNPDTHDVVLRIRDATTDQVLSETPTKEVQAMSKYLNDYAATLSRHRAALKNPPAN